MSTTTTDRRQAAGPRRAGPGALHRRRLRRARRGVQRGQPALGGEHAHHQRRHARPAGSPSSRRSAAARARPPASSRAATSASTRSRRWCARPRRPPAPAGPPRTRAARHAEQVPAGARAGTTSRPRRRSASSASSRSTLGEVVPRRPGRRPRRCSASPSTSCTRRTSAPRPGYGSGTPSPPAGSRSPARRADWSRSTWVGHEHPRLQRRRHGGRRRRAGPPARLGASAGSTCTAGRYETLLPPSAVADLMIYLYWTLGRPRRRRRPHGVQPARAAAPASASGWPTQARCGCGATRRPRACSATRSCSPTSSGSSQSVFDNGLPIGATDWIARRRAQGADPDPALGRADRAAGDARRRQPAVRARPTRPAASTRWSPTPRAVCC